MTLGYSPALEHHLLFLQQGHVLDYEKPNYSTTGNYTSAQEIGKYFGCSSDGNTGHRGGSWQVGNNAGIFAISLNRSPSASDSYIGFRCVR
jgi:hypothetical protein